MNNFNGLKTTKIKIIEREFVLIRITASDQYDRIENIIQIFDELKENKIIIKFENL